MRALVHHSYGGPEQLGLEDVAAPRPGKGQVLIGVEAAAVDRGTWLLLHGRPYLVRLAFGLRRPRNPVVGRDVAGVVLEVGEGVEDFGVGDAVHGTADGSLAEQAVVPVKRLAHRPATLTAGEAAAVPVSGLTAFQAVRSAQVGPGQRVLVIGGSGGVGTWLVQLAADAGAEVTASCSPANAELVASLGAAHVVGHAEALVPPPADKRYDAVFAVGGNHRLRDQRRLLAHGGVLVQVGRDDPGAWTAGYLRSAGCALLSPFLRGHRVVLHTARELGSDLADLDALIDAGRVRPVVERAYAFEEAVAAIEHLGSGRPRAKVVVGVRPTG